MKAIVLHEFGNADKLKFEDADVPAITADQVLIKIAAASVNHFEIKIATGNMQKMVPVDLPWIPGYDFSGTVEKTGANVTDFTVGNEVYGQTPKGGAYAEFLAVGQGTISIKPTSIDFIHAASVPVVAMTAYQGLFLHGRLKAGQTVLIHGGAGAVGAYAVQLAKNGGAVVIATAAGVDIEFVRSLGAEKVIDYENEKFEDHLQNADVVLDLIGGETQQRSYPVMKKGGILVATSQPPKKDDAEKYSITALMMNMEPNTKDLTELAALIDSGALKTDVAKTFQLEKAADAWKAISPNINKDSTEAKEKIGHGKAVLAL